MQKFAMFTRKTALPTGGHLHEDWTLNVTSTVFTSFEHDRGIIGTNFLTKFHENRTRNVASKVFTRFLYSTIMKTAPPTGGHVFQWTRTTFELNQHIIKKNILTNCCVFFLLSIIGTNLLTKFHEDLTRNVASRVFTRKTAPPTGGHVFQRTETTFELDQHIYDKHFDTYLQGFAFFWTYFELDRGIIGTNLLTKFHENRTRNVASKVFTRFLYSKKMKTAPPTGGHVFQWTRTTFELDQHIYNKHFDKCLQVVVFKLDRGIIGTNLLTKFHENRTRNVASEVFTRFLNSQIMKTAPPTGSHVFQRTRTTTNIFT
ncbi:hypothetical protein DPMN_008390, partial [Dreissena polymorpha]